MTSHLTTRRERRIDAFKKWWFDRNKDYVKYNSPELVDFSWKHDLNKWLNTGMSAEWYPEGWIQ